MVQTILRFIKTHWISLACGVVSVAAIVLAALGMTSTAVIAKMNQIKGQSSAIDSLRREPQNEETIAAEQQRTKEFQDKYTAALDFAAEHNRREPILAGVFPNPGLTSLRYKFLEQYNLRLRDLPRVMKAGQLPTEREAANEQEILDDIKRRKAEQDGETAGAAAQPERSVPGRGEERGGRARAPMQRAGRMPPAGAAAGPTEAGAPAPAAAIQVTPEAQYRAEIRKARTIPVYATLEAPEPSFYVSPIVGSNDPPSPRDMWYAQVSLWIQHDVAEAIAKVNDEAAAQLGDRAANVTTLPIKRLVRIDMLGYVTPAKELVGFTPPAGGVAASPETFTGRVSDERFDVLRFNLTVVMDQREIPKLVDALTRENFYQLVNLSFVAEPPDSERDDGYFYGAAPLVRVTLDFEGYMARKVYKEMMPKEVLTELGIGQSAGPQ